MPTVQDLHPHRDRTGEHTKWMEHAEELEGLADPLESATIAIAVIDDALCPCTPPSPQVIAPAADAAPAVCLKMDSLKPPTLCLDSTPYDLKQWKMKFGTYFHRTSCKRPLDGARGHAQRLLWMHRGPPQDQDTTPRRPQR